MRRLKLIGLPLAYTALLTATIMQAACAPLVARLPKLPDGSVDVVKLLTITEDGVNEGCSREWLPAKVCTLSQDAINTAVAVYQAHKGDADKRAVYAAVLKSLKDSEAAWPATENGSRLFDFFTWLTDALAVLATPAVPAGGSPATP